jgi:hypothetical protein
MATEGDQPKIEFVPGIIQGDVVNIIVGNSNTIGPIASGHDDSARTTQQALDHDTAKPQDAGAAGTVSRVLAWLAGIAKLAGSVIREALVALLGARLKAIFGG